MVGRKWKPNNENHEVEINDGSPEGQSVFPKGQEQERIHQQHTHLHVPQPFCRDSTPAQESPAVAETHGAQDQEGLCGRVDQPGRGAAREVECHRAQSEAGRVARRARAESEESPDLQQWVLLLNRASRKKADLQKFNHDQLQLAVSESATIAQLQKQAMERIYQMSKADPTDPVGFGEHSALSYQEILVSQPSYCKWVIKTSSEGQCCARLTRLATWLLTQKDKPVPLPVPVAVPAQKGHSTSSEVSSSSTAALVGVMQQMMVKMDEMKEEIEEIRGRPHKKAVKTEEMDDQSSWSPLTEPWRPSQVREA